MLNADKIALMVCLHRRMANPRIIAFSAVFTAAALPAANFACADPPLPVIPSAVFNVTNYGAVGDGLNGMTVSNVTFNGTSNGLRLKAGANYGGLVQNVSYSNITMTNVAMPLAITSFYEHGSDNFPTDPTAVTAATINRTTPLWKNISFNGITATGAAQDGLIYGEPLTGSGAPATNFNGLSLSHINISGYQGLGVYYVQNLQLGTGNTFLAQSGPGLSVYGDTLAVPEPAVWSLLCFGSFLLQCGKKSVPRRVRA